MNINWNIWILNMNVSRNTGIWILSISQIKQKRCTVTHSLGLQILQKFSRSWCRNAWLYACILGSDYCTQYIRICLYVYTLYMNCMSQKYGSGCSQSKLAAQDGFVVLCSICQADLYLKTHANNAITGRWQMRGCKDSKIFFFFLLMVFHS